MTIKPLPKEKLIETIALREQVIYLQLDVNQSTQEDLAKHHSD